MSPYEYLTNVKNKGVYLCTHNTCTHARARGNISDCRLNVDLHCKDQPAIMGITRPTAKYGTLTTSTLARSGEKGVAAMPRIYYAITGIGWGRGSTPSEALENYLSAQRLNFPHLSEDELQEPWGFVWQAPVGTTGFYDSPRGMTWKVDDGVRDWAVPFDPADKVENVGNVPSQFAL